MSSPHRFTTNARPMDHRSGIEPMEQSRFIPPWWFSVSIMVCVVGLVVWS